MGGATETRPNVQTDDRYTAFMDTHARAKHLDVRSYVTWPVSADPPKKNKAKKKPKHHT